ncbi:MAG: DUF3810 domain-containing protein [Oscillospiraceae bacterium]
MAVGAGALAVVAFCYLARGNAALMAWLCRAVSRPWHGFMSRLCAAVPFSVAEVIYALTAGFVVVYIIRAIILLITQENKGKRVYITLLTLAMTASLFWAGFSLLWSPCYYAPSFTEQSGVSDGPISAEALAEVTERFAAAANEYGALVERGEDGVFAPNRESVLDRAAGVFDGASALFGFLDGAPLRPKPILCSGVMSMMNFTGFFFPMTGEANLNMSSPACMLPATAEHELSHQRGIAAEQECNFIAILACAESHDADFAYSGALLAYVYLGNALYSADKPAWEAVYATLSDNVRRDLAANSKYWEKYNDTAVRKVSDKVYEAFLQDNGQTLGLKSYGACVDLLVNYYA